MWDLDLGLPLLPPMCALVSKVKEGPPPCVPAGVWGMELWILLMDLDLDLAWILWICIIL